jgi:hypothetical protein
MATIQHRSKFKHTNEYIRVLIQYVLFHLETSNDNNKTTITDDKHERVLLNEQTKYFR